MPEDVAGDRGAKVPMTERKPRVEVPKIGAQTADTHAHLDMLDDPAGALERASVAGVMFIATVADVTEAPLGTFDALGTWLADAEERMDLWGVPHPEAPTMRIIVGVHPHNAKGYTPEVAATLTELAKDPRVCAIGETGLDFHYDHSPRDHQRRAFEAQVALAGELGLPIAVHLREAHEEGMAILRSVGVPKAGCVIHCFTEGPKTAELFLEMGCHISFAGPVTFPKADVIRKAVDVVPLDRLLVETDCPFMTPVPHRGRSNEPAWVTFVVEAIAEIKQVDPAKVAVATLDNARAVLGQRR
jgi:TatD DNase family protein